MGSIVVTNKVNNDMFEMTRKEMSVAWHTLILATLQFFWTTIGNQG